MDPLIRTSDRLIGEVPYIYTRYLYSQINWKARLISIMGSRGVGKTTFLLQRVRELTAASSGQAVYMSLGNPWFYSRSLVDTAGRLVRSGGSVLFLDDVHRYPAKSASTDWSTEIKEAYNLYPSLQIVYAGPALLGLYRDPAGLGLLKTEYALKGLSLREYLIFRGIVNLPPVSANDLLANHPGIASAVIAKVRIIPHYRRYLRSGYYPFFRETSDHYADRVRNMINIILENDLPAITGIPWETVVRIKKLLALLAVHAPRTPNLSRVREELGITDHRTLLKYIHYLEEAGLLTVFAAHRKGDQLAGKPGSIHLGNPGLLMSFHSNPDASLIRDTFLISQAVDHLSTAHSEPGSFLFHNTLTISTGRPIRSTRPHPPSPNGYLALDDLEIGAGRTIPLWLFGFLY